MKIGIHSRIWGIKFRDIRRALDLIAEAGYQGVEFSQRWDALGVQGPEELLELLKERNLVLLSLTNGTLKERLAFCRKSCPEYLYIKHWDLKKIPAMKRLGFTPALHPGMFTPIRRIADAVPLLKKYPALRLLFDTAHLTIAGDDLLTSIQQVKDRLAAVHLKDWTPEFGRSGPRYGRGFTEFGHGIVNLDSVLQELQKISYDGWLVAEIEKLGDEVSAIAASAEWLATRGLLPKPPKLTGYSGVERRAMFPRQEGKCPPEAEARFREAITFASVGRFETFYESIAAAFNELIPCDLIRIWTCSPAQDQMALLVSTNPTSPHFNEGDIHKPYEMLTGIAIDREAQVTHFDLTEEHPGRRFGYPKRDFVHPKLLKETHAKRMLAIPIYNSENRNHARLVVNLFPHEEEIQITDEEFYWLGKAVTIATDAMLDGRCSSASVKVSLLASQRDYTQGFLDELKKRIQESINCEGVAIFLVNERGDKLELAATTGTGWSVSEDEQFYRKGEGLTGKVWERNEPILTINSLSEPDQKGKSEEQVATQKQHACVWVPFVDSRGKVVGVLRCRNKSPNPGMIIPNMFSDDDAAVLDAIGQAAVPHLQILLDKERRAKALGRLTHELRSPLVAIRGAAEFMMRTKDVGKLFDYDYPGDVWSWSELMRRLLGNADLFQYSPEDFPVRATPTLMMGEVVAPALKQAKMLLDERGFSVDYIRYGKFEGIPRLWVDQNQFQQVIFNLLSNAIKYCFKDKKSFQVEIDGEKRGGEFAIWFRDWGPGIKAEMKELIFEEGFRTLEATERNVTGQGLGLWIVRQIIEAHGGRIALTKARWPTEFTIYLPGTLARQAPNQRIERRNRK